MVQRSRIDLKCTSYKWNECTSWEALVVKDQQFFGKQARQGALGDDTAPSPLGYLNIAIIANAVQVVNH